MFIGTSCGLRVTVISTDPAKSEMIYSIERPITWHKYQYKAVEFYNSHKSVLFRVGLYGYYWSWGQEPLPGQLIVI